MGNCCCCCRQDEDDDDDDGPSNWPLLSSEQPGVGYGSRNPPPSLGQCRCHPHNCICSLCRRGPARPTKDVYHARGTSNLNTEPKCKYPPQDPLYQHPRSLQHEDRGSGIVSRPLRPLYSFTNVGPVDPRSHHSQASENPMYRDMANSSRYTISRAGYLHDTRDTSAYPEQPPAYDEPSYSSAAACVQCGSDQPQRSHWAYRDETRQARVSQQYGQGPVYQDERLPRHPTMPPNSRHQEQTPYNAGQRGVQGGRGQNRFPPGHQVQEEPAHMNPRPSAIEEQRYDPRVPPPAQGYHGNQNNLSREPEFEIYPPDEETVARRATSPAQDIPVVSPQGISTRSTSGEQNSETHTSGISSRASSLLSSRSFSHSTHHYHGNVTQIYHIHVHDKPQSNQ